MNDSARCFSDQLFLSSITILNQHHHHYYHLYFYWFIIFLIGYSLFPLQILKFIFWITVSISTWFIYQWCDDVINDVNQNKSSLVSISFCNHKSKQQNQISAHLACWTPIIFDLSLSFILFFSHLAAPHLCVFSLTFLFFFLPIQLVISFPPPPILL